MVKIERLKIELAVLLMISLVAFGGFVSLNLEDESKDSIDDSDNELTGDFKIKKPKFIKQIQKEVGRIDDNIKDAIKRESPKPVVCAQVITYARDQKGNCQQFPNACIPPGWTKVSSCPICVGAYAMIYAKNIRTGECKTFSNTCISATEWTKVPSCPKLTPAPKPSPTLIPKPTPTPKPVPTCPQECLGPGSFCHNKRLPACPEGTIYVGPIDQPVKNIKCAHACEPVKKKTCRIDISNCPLALKSNFKSNIISGTPDPRYDANSINGQCLIDPSNLKNPFGNQYWKYSAPCGKILQRQ